MSAPPLQHDQYRDNTCREKGDNEGSVYDGLVHLTSSPLVNLIQISVILFTVGYEMHGPVEALQPRVRDQSSVPKQIQMIDMEMMCLFMQHAIGEMNKHTQMSIKSKARAESHRIW